MNLADALAMHRQGRVAEAEAGYRAVLAADPGQPDAYYLLGLIAVQTARLDAAIESLRQAAALAPGQPQFHADLGSALGMAGQPAEAVEAFGRALALQPGLPDVWSSKATALNALGRHREALAAADQAIGLQPAHAFALDNRGTALTGLGRAADALADHDRAIALAPDIASLHNSRGATLQALGRHDDALAAHDRALLLAPGNAEAHNNRATALQALGRWADALAAYGQALTIRPDYAGARSNRAILLQMLGRAVEALADFDAALALRDDSGTRFAASMCRLLLGDTDAGWRDFEYRWDQPLMAGERRDWDRPRWRGETGGTVLLFAEQGFGDTLQFCRYAIVAAARGVRVILEVQPALVRLMRRLDDRIVVVARGDALPAFDFQCPLMSLPLVLGARPPLAAGYLRPDPDRVLDWRIRLSKIPGRKIGLVWSGAPRAHSPELHAADQRRSVRLNQLAALANVPDVTFVSLQKGKAEAQPVPPGMRLLSFGGELHDFDDTAALVAALELVIGVDTAVVHLAGGLGIPVWIANRFDTCWRWGLERTDSDWYRSATLFRQRSPGDWDDVARRVAIALHG
jgi:tetratricopeptide (TPR) repeat protein